MAGKNPSQKLYLSQLGGEQPIPAEFVAAMQRREEIQADPNNVGPEDLSDIIVSSYVTTDRTDERVRHTIKKVAGTITLRNINTNQQGQPVQVTRVMFQTGSQEPAPPTATTKVGVTDLGNGFSIQESTVEGTYVDGVFTPGIFSAPNYEIEIPDAIPEKFRVILPTKTTVETTTGVAAMPTLATGDLRKSSSQVDEFLVRNETTRREAILFPVTLISHETNEERQDVTVTEILQRTIDPIPVESATQTVEASNLGNGTVLVVVRSVTGYATEQGQTFERETGIALPFTEKTLSKADAEALIGTPYVDITPRDEQRSEVKTNTVPSASYDSYQRSFATSIERVDLPDALTSLDVTYTSGGNDGSYSEDGNTSGTSISLSIQGNGTASTAITPQLIYTIDRASGQNVPAMQYEFLLPQPVTLTAIKSKISSLIAGAPTINSWPSWKPQAINLILRSEKRSVQAQASSHLNATSDSNSHSTGIGASEDYSPSLTQIDIPATIHEAFSLGGSSTNTVTARAIASQSGFFDLPADTGELSCTVTASVTPNEIGATVPSTIPTSGLYLYSYRGQNYRDGYVMYVCIVIDAANL